MPKVKKPAPKKGGEKKAAPKKKARKSVTKLTERQADQLAADKMRADSFASTQPKHPTDEEQFEREYEIPKPSLLRRALNSVKRAFRFRSAKTGEFVSQSEAEASPDTTVRERVK